MLLEYIFKVVKIRNYLNFIGQIGRIILLRAFLRLSCFFRPKVAQKPRKSRLERSVDKSFERKHKEIAEYSVNSPRFLDGKLDAQGARYF